MKVHFNISGGDGMLDLFYSASFFLLTMLFLLVMWRLSFPRPHSNLSA